MSGPQLPSWPTTPPAAGAVVLRRFDEDDVPMVIDLATDPYVPLIGSLPARTDADGARAWIHRQLSRWDEGAGFSFAVAEATTGRAVGAIGLWLRDLAAGRATSGYSIAPRERGHGYARDALVAVTAFARTIPGLERIELHVEPRNVASLRTAERAGFARRELLRRHQVIGGRQRDVWRYTLELD